MLAEVADEESPDASAIPRILGASVVVGVLAGLAVIAYLSVEHALQGLLWDTIPDGLGGTERGITISSNPNAVVTAPADGWVHFAGPYRGYGHLLIINAGNGYHVVLAGMDRLSVEIGQFVLAGEPLGFLGTAPALVETEAAKKAGGAAGEGGQSASAAPSSTATPNPVSGPDPVSRLGGTRPALYVEFRKDGSPVDPSPWWSSQLAEKARG